MQPLWMQKDVELRHAWRSAQALQGSQGARHDQPALARHEAVRTHRPGGRSPMHEAPQVRNARGAFARGAFHGHTLHGALGAGHDGHVEESAVRLPGLRQATHLRRPGRIPHPLRGAS